MKFKDAIKFLEQGWTQGCLARNKDGRKTHPWNTDAVCFCAVGALVKAYEGDATEVETARDMLNALLIEGGKRTLAAWNDELGRTKEDVIKLFEEAACLTTKSENSKDN